MGNAKDQVHAACEHLGRAESAVAETIEMLEEGEGGNPEGEIEKLQEIQAEMNDLIGKLDELHLSM